MKFFLALVYSLITPLNVCFEILASIIASDESMVKKTFRYLCHGFLKQLFEI